MQINYREGARVVAGKSVLQLWAEEEGAETGPHHQQISRATSGWRI